MDHTTEFSIDIYTGGACCWGRVWVQGKGSKVALGMGWKLSRRLEIFLSLIQHKERLFRSQFGKQFYVRLYNSRSATLTGKTFSIKIKTSNPWKTLTFLWLLGLTMSSGYCLCVKSHRVIMAFLRITRFPPISSKQARRWSCYTLLCCKEVRARYPVRACCQSLGVNLLSVFEGWTVYLPLPLTWINCKLKIHQWVNNS